MLANCRYRTNAGIVLPRPRGAARRVKDWTAELLAQGWIDVTSGVNFTENQRFEIARLCGV